jgi:hypothetical protein
MFKQTLAMGNGKRIGSLFCLRTNLARNRTAIRTQIRTRVDGPKTDFFFKNLVRIILRCSFPSLSLPKESASSSSCLNLSVFLSRSLRKASLSLLFLKGFGSLGDSPNQNIASRSVSRPVSKKCVCSGFSAKEQNGAC